MVCAAMEVMPTSRYSSADGVYPVLPHIVSFIHDTNDSFHFVHVPAIKSNFLKRISTNKTLDGQIYRNLML